MNVLKRNYSKLSKRNHLFLFDVNTAGAVTIYTTILIPIVPRGGIQGHKKPRTFNLYGVSLKSLLIQLTLSGAPFYYLLLESL